MRTTVTLDRLKKKDYLSFSEQYRKSYRIVSNETQFKLFLSEEPPYTACSEVFRKDL
ncbi:MAG: hypothetical protein K8R54_15340 [Bacteroidales bacterium]|nr:hypothetical protein [Bacteroidales bacterium]